MNPAAQGSVAEALMVHIVELAGYLAPLPSMIKQSNMVWELLLVLAV